MYVEPGARRVTAQAGGLADMSRIGAELADSGIEIDDLGLKRPSLDDVFLSLTGHRAEEEPEESDDFDSETRRKVPCDDDPRPASRPTAPRSSRSRSPHRLRPSYAAT